MSIIVTAIIFAFPYFSMAKIMNELEFDNSIVTLASLSVGLLSLVMYGIFCRLHELNNDKNRATRD